MNPVYPWQQAQAEQITQWLVQQRLPHALLLDGGAGLGKAEFAEQLAQHVLCESINSGASQQPCGRCQSCRLWAAGNHPDWYKVALEVNPKDGKQAQSIKVDQIRQLSDALILTSQQGQYKVAMILDAHRMNINAANSLLKTLEEPTDKTLILLVTDEPAQLLPTIRSRCQRLFFSAPSPAQASDWLSQQGVPPEQVTPLLALSSGAPLLALSANEQGWIEQRATVLNVLIHIANGERSPIDAASSIVSCDLTAALSWMMAWAVDVKKLQHVSDALAISNQDYHGVLSTLSSRANTTRLDTWYEQLLQCTRQVNGSLNAQQWLEACLCDWKRVFEIA